MLTTSAAVRAAFIVSGVAWMVVMLYAAVRVPRLRAVMILFATAPGFQLAWLGLVNQRGPRLIIPVLVVPLSVGCYTILTGLRRYREETGRTAADETARRKVLE